MSMHLPGFKAIARRRGVHFAVGLSVIIAAASGWRPGRATTQAPAIANPHGDLRAACEECHSAAGWTTLRDPIAFDHAKTGFPLQGKHRGATCKDCHAALVFSRVAVACADCHRDVHEGRNGLRCQDCHTPEQWVGRADALRQHAATGFPLRGMHALLECTRCHASPGEASIAKLSNDCVSCHADEYAATTAPNHAAAAYATRCEQCHDASHPTWTGAGFDHATTGFALAGAHRALHCSQCHLGGSHAGLDPSCVSCHRDEYDATTNPSHAAANFGTDCAACHSTSGWRPANFDHDSQYFRINSGKHARRWPSCATCHLNPSSYADFSCFQCHEHNKADMDDKHRERPGYQYESNACYGCHRNV